MLTSLSEAGSCSWHRAQCVPTGTVLPLALASNLQRLLLWPPRSPDSHTQLWVPGPWAAGLWASPLSAPGLGPLPAPFPRRPATLRGRRGQWHFCIFLLAMRPRATQRRPTGSQKIGTKASPAVQRPLPSSLRPQLPSALGHFCEWRPPREPGPTRAASFTCRPLLLPSWVGEREEP